MEAELLRSKTEMMQLNNQLLEAVQKRLELSLELEAWKVKAVNQSLRGRAQTAGTPMKENQRKQSTLSS